MPLDVAAVGDVERRARACRRRGRRGRRRRRSCWSCRAAAAPAAAAREREPRNSAPSTPWTRPSPLLRTMSRIPARRARPASPAGPARLEADVDDVGRPASTASISPCRPVALAQRVADHGDPAAALTPAAPPRPARQDGLDQIEVGRLVDVDRGLGHRHRDGDPRAEPREASASPARGSRGAAGRPRASAGPKARASRQGALRSRSIRPQNAIRPRPPPASAAGTGWRPSSRRRGSAGRSACVSG